MAYAQIQRPVDPNPPGEQLTTCPEGFKLTETTPKVCQADPTMECELPSTAVEGSVDVCQTITLRDPICGSGMHLTEDNTAYIFDHNGVDSGVEPSCSQVGGTLQRIDGGAWYCATTTFSQATIPTCPTGELNEENGLCEMSL